MKYLDKARTQDSQSRVFDRLFKVLDKVQDDRQTVKAYAWYIYYKDKDGKIGKSLELGFNKDDALKDFNRKYSHYKGGVKIIKVEQAPTSLKPIQATLRQNKKIEQIRNKIGDEIKRFVIPKTNINTLSYMLGAFLENNEKSKSYQFGNNKGFSYTLTFQRLSKDSVRVIYKANKQSFSMVLSGIYKNTNETKFAEKIAHKIDTINSLKGIRANDEVKNSDSTPVFIVVIQNKKNKSEFKHIRVFNKTNARAAAGFVREWLPKQKEFKGWEVETAFEGGYANNGLKSVYA